MLAPRIRSGSVDKQPQNVSQTKLVSTYKVSANLWWCLPTCIGSSQPALAAPNLHLYLPIHISTSPLTWVPLNLHCYLPTYILHFNHHWCLPTYWFGWTTIAMGKTRPDTNFMRQLAFLTITLLLTDQSDVSKNSNVHQHLFQHLWKVV